MRNAINRELVRQKVTDMGLAEAAVATGLSLSLLAKICSGAYQHAVSHKNLKKMCKGFRVTMDELVPGMKAS
jgi:hypothetical protein